MPEAMMEWLWCVYDRWFAMKPAASLGAGVLALLVVLIPYAINWWGVVLTDGLLVGWLASLYRYGYVRQTYPFA